MGTGEVQVGQGIHLGLFHDGGCLGTALLEHLACQVVGTTHHTRVLGPEDRGDDLGDPPLQLPRLGLADAVAREVHDAPLPGGSLELLGYGALEALVGVRDDELGPVDPSRSRRTRCPRPISPARASSPLRLSRWP